VNAEEKFKEIIDTYERLVSEVDQQAMESDDRAYGGVVRAEKGKLVESIAEHLMRIAWMNLGGNEDNISFEHKTIKVPIKEDYIGRIRSREVREYIESNKEIMFYRIKPDVQVYLNGQFRVAMECKAYTENAMLKRILVDCTLLKNVCENLSFVLLQLESQLGGDYSDIFKEIHLGSPSTHTLLSYFDVDLNIITLLEGERRVDKPIHKEEHYKPLRVESLKRAVKVMEQLLIEGDKL